MRDFELESQKASIDRMCAENMAAKKKSLWHIRETTRDGYTVHDSNDKVVFDHVFGHGEHEHILKAVRAVNADESSKNALNEAAQTLYELMGEIARDALFCSPRMKVAISSAYESCRCAITKAEEK